jgi:hypothetical protein
MLRPPTGRRRARGARPSPRRPLPGPGRTPPCRTSHPMWRRSLWRKGGVGSREGTPRSRKRPCLVVEGLQKGRDSSAHAHRRSVGVGIRQGGGAGSAAPPRFGRFSWAFDGGGEQVRSVRLPEGRGRTAPGSSRATPDPEKLSGFPGPGDGRMSELRQRFDRAPTSSSASGRREPWLSSGTSAPTSSGRGPR